MSADLLLTNVSYPGLFKLFSCTLPAGISTLIVTEHENECAALTHLITGLKKPAEGSVLLDGHDLATFDQERICSHRRAVGIVPAQGGLISNLKVWENIFLPAEYHDYIITAEMEQVALVYLEKTGFTGNLMALPAHLTVQEKRMVALVRAFMTDPRIIVYSDCFDGWAQSHGQQLAKMMSDFHSAVQDRISIYLTSSADMVKVLRVDTVVYLHDTGKGTYDT